MRHDGSDRADTFPDRRTVEAARAGDAGAVERLTAGVLPLVYNVVGRAAERDLDVDDIVQDTMVAVIRALPELRDAAKFRSWLVAIAVRQLTDARRRARSGRLTTLEHADERHAPEPDFATLFLLRQSLSAEQRQVAAATAWLDPSHRDLLSLWWLEACGRLSRKDIAAAVNLPAAHLAVQVQRMKGQLDVARTVVRALSRTPRCAELTELAGPGDPDPSPLLRKRIARHLRSCQPCGHPAGRLVPPERLLAGLPLLVPGRTGDPGAAGATGWTGPAEQPALGEAGSPPDAVGGPGPGADDPVGAGAGGSGATPPGRHRPAHRSPAGAPRARPSHDRPHSWRPRSARRAVRQGDGRDRRRRGGRARRDGPRHGPFGGGELRRHAQYGLPGESAGDDDDREALPHRAQERHPAPPPARLPRPAPSPVDARVLRTSLPAKTPAPTYFVSPGGSDSNPGTSAGSPFRTLQKAADLVEPGDVVAVMNGTYTEPRKGSNVLTIKRSGRPGAPITFTAYPGHRPVLNPRTAWNGISVYGASHIVIENLEVKGNNAALSLADAERSSSKTDPTYNTNCISVEKNRESGTYPHHVDITGNLVHGCAGGGISAIEADHVDIIGNHVHSNAWFTVYGTSGISVLTPRDTGGGDPRTYKIRITGNRVHDNETKVKWEGCHCYSDGNGIIVDTTKGDPERGRPAYNGRVLVANNISYDNGGSGIHAYKSQHVDIVHNTAYLNGRSTRITTPYANIFAHDSTDVRLLNNIAYGRPGQATNSTSRNVNVTYDYNIYFGGKAPETKGPHDIVADPKFTAPGKSPDADFRLTKGSPAIGSATPFPAMTTDFTGATRKGGAPDRGAYGFGATAQAATGGGEASAPGGESPNAGAGEPSGDTEAGPSAGADAADGASGDDDPGLTAHGGSRPMARTGGFDPVLPLGIAAGVLVAGAGLLVLTRRRRS
ncbi:sigma-70 family RNA polymerase sigma factor [Streptomyces antibioticus]|uniref:RNA polymerase sigma factor n=1 Tax=Streptomyces antibioticus TaxID=1890 RepID=A0AAE6YDP8_STRAT|nr:sigma-70 family RNA polymerase sigma factor [Streptomyces antibioticus]QIT47845.1 sigma-70 family RNA polymerase sigma factor [Streptomyces antibioticus]